MSWHSILTTKLIEQTSLAHPWLQQPVPGRTTEEWRYWHLNWLTRSLDITRNPTPNITPKGFDLASILNSHHLALPATDNPTLIIVDNKHLPTELPPGIHVVTTPPTGKSKNFSDDPRWYLAQHADLCGNNLEIDLTENNTKLTVINLITENAGYVPLHFNVKVAENVSATLNYYTLSTAAAPVNPTWLNQIFTFELAKQAKLAWVEIQDLPHNINLSRTLKTTLAAASHFAPTSINLGSAYNHNQWLVDLAGEYAQINAHALCLVADTQNHNLIIDCHHNAAHTTSTQNIAGIASEKATFSYRGQANINQNIQFCNATQQNRNLLIGNYATINSQPRLEIYNDEVQCAHGATIGSLDEQALFYLQSRGYSHQDAHKTLLEAFMLAAVPECHHNKWLTQRLHLATQRMAQRIGSAS